MNIRYWECAEVQPQLQDKAIIYWTTLPKHFYDSCRFINRHTTLGTNISQWIWIATKEVEIRRGLLRPFVVTVLRWHHSYWVFNLKTFPYNKVCSERIGWNQKRIYEALCCDHLKVKSQLLSFQSQNLSLVQSLSDFNLFVRFNIN